MLMLVNGRLGHAKVFSSAASTVAKILRTSGCIISIRRRRLHWHWRRLGHVRRHAEILWSSASTVTLSNLLRNSTIVIIGTGRTESYWRCW